MSNTTPIHFMIFFHNATSIHLWKFLKKIQWNHKKLQHCLQNQIWISRDEFFRFFFQEMKSKVFYIQQSHREEFTSLVWGKLSVAVDPNQLRTIGVRALVICWLLGINSSVTQCSSGNWQDAFIQNLNLKCFQLFTQI